MAVPGLGGGSRLRHIDGVRHHRDYRRLLGLASANRRYTEMARELLPWTWGAWVVAAIFGTLLMASRPASYFANTDYRLKFVCMGLAFINMLVFQFVTSRDIAQWDKGGASLAGKVAGGLSLVLWSRLLRPQDRLHPAAERRALNCKQERDPHHFIRPVPLLPRPACGERVGV
jgi:hypothetical protein